MIMLKCNNKGCGYEWDYNGKSDYYASCPRCRGSVKVRNTKKDGDECEEGEREE